MKQRLHWLAPGLPQARCFIFECHLGTRRRRVDLSLGGLRALPRRLDHPALQERASLVWLEYDLDEARRVPAVFVGVGQKHADDPAVLGTLIVAMGAPLPAAEGLSRLVVATAAAKGKVWLTHLGVMRGRAGCPLRVNVGGRSPLALRRFLEAMGGSMEICRTLDALCAVVAGEDPDLILAFDLCADGPARLGLECYFPRDETAWDRMLHRLVAGGLCSDREVQAILSWSGRSMEKSVTPLEAFLGARREGTFLRVLNHLKLAALRPGAFRAKVYLAVFRMAPRAIGVEADEGERSRR